MRFIGKVVHGGNVGNRFSVSTANLEISNDISLEEGVYFVLVRFEEREQEGILHFGDRKTFGMGFSAEVHILDFQGDLYGKVLEVEILQKERDIQKFSNADALFTQIEKDIVRAQKFFFRRKMKELWQNVSQKKLEKSVQELIKKFEQHEKFQKAKSVFLYAPIEFEIPFVEKLCKTFPEKNYFFPKIKEEKLIFGKSKWEDLKVGQFGILEPVITDANSSSYLREKDIIFVPALAGDKQLNRLGRGGGYYDRFLKNISAWKVTVLPEFAYMEKIPVEKHDMRVDEVMVMRSE